MCSISPQHLGTSLLLNDSQSVILLHPRRRSKRLCVSGPLREELQNQRHLHSRTGGGLHLQVRPAHIQHITVDHCTTHETVTNGNSVLQRPDVSGRQPQQLQRDPETDQQGRRLLQHQTLPLLPSRPLLLHVESVNGDGTQQAASLLYITR